MSEQASGRRVQPPQLKNCKPRELWRIPRRKLRVFEEVEVKPGKFRLYEFRLMPDGLHVRVKRGRKRHVWPYSKLANGCNPTSQMMLI